MRWIAMLAVACAPDPTDPTAGTVPDALVPVDAPPVARTMWLTTVEDTPISAVFDAADDEGEALTFTVEVEPEAGTITMEPGGRFTYTPEPGFLGLDAFLFTASDGVGRSGPARVDVTVLARP